MFGLDIGSFKDILHRNPLEYGDALGLTHGPLSGRAPGKLTDQGLDYQSKINPFVSRGKLETANDVAPFVAAAIATFGGSAAPSAAPQAGSMMPAASPMMPPAVAESSAGPAASSSTPAWLKFMRMGQMGNSLLGGMGGQQQQMMQAPMQPHMQSQGLLGGYPGYSYQPLTSAPGLLGRQMMMGPNLFGGG